jgi:hypothetical protein
MNRINISFQNFRTPKKNAPEHNNVTVKLSYREQFNGFAVELFFVTA